MRLHRWRHTIPCLRTRPSLALYAGKPGESPDDVLNSAWHLIKKQMILPIFVVGYVYCLPESPRWLLKKAHREDSDYKRKKYYEKAWAALCSLRHTKLQAARDLFLIHHLLLNEKMIMEQDKPFLELFTHGRNRRALTASTIVMFLQQFCGVNGMCPRVVE